MLENHRNRQALATACSRSVIDALEPRILFYSATVFDWASHDVSYSFMPDGSLVDGYASRLFAELNAVAPTSTWQREIARALQTWSQYTPLNFHLTTDDGSPKGTLGQVQGDSRYGDIRFGTRVLGSNVLGYAHFPNIGTTGSTEGGDVALNSDRTYSIGSLPDLYSVLLHETGHSLGLDHSTAGTVMYGATTTVHSGLTADDIAGIRSIYGARQQDAFDAASANNALASATSLGLVSGAANVRADLTSQSDVDYYKVVATSSSMTVSVDARGISLLAPKVGVYDAAGNLLATASADYGKVATVNVSGLVAGQTYYIVADGATADVFGMGAYKLNVAFAAASGGTDVDPVVTPPPAAPGNLAAAAGGAGVINLVWQDNSVNEDGFRIERSSDGVNFAPLASTGANERSYSATGLSAGTTYYFRVRAVNVAGASGWSNVAQATTAAAPLPPPPPPPGPSADRYEFNDTIAAAKSFGRVNNTTQADLTIHASTDVDYFTWTAGANGTFNVSVLSSASGGAVDAQLYDGQQRMMSDAETATLTLRKGQRYYLKVAGTGGAAGAYDVAITRISGKTSTGSGAFLLEKPRGGAAKRDLVTDDPAVATPGGCGCPLCTGTVLAVNN